MEDGEVKIKTLIDNSELAKGAEDAKGIISGFAKNLQSRKFANIGASISGIGIALKAANAGFKAAAATVKDFTDTYKKQANAEKQLETAAKNNPYLDESSVRQLKKFASGLQEISTVGDEQLIPMMGQLAASGRTQQEIMDIMAAATDIAASGAMGLEEAVRGLNASFSGQLGTLGKSLPMLKNLTAEELKQGKAVKEAAKAFKGMAEETAKATGSAEQLSNAWGDFKEHLGEGLEKAFAPVRRHFTGILSDINNMISRTKELKSANENISAGKATVADYDVKIEQAKKEIENLEKTLQAHKKTYRETGIDNGMNEVMKELQRQRDIMRQLYEAKGRLQEPTKKQLELEKQAAEAAERAAAAEKARAEAKQRWNDLAVNALESYENSVDAVEREIAAREQLGDTISEQEKAQMRYNARYQGYIRLLTDAQGAISGNLDREKGKLAEINELAEYLAKYDKADYYAEKGKERKEKAEVEVDWKITKNSLEEAKEEIEKLNAALLENSALTVEQKIELEEKYREAVEEINRQILEGDEEMKKQRIQNLAETMSEIENYVSQTVSIMQDAASLMLDTVRWQSEAEQAEIELKYRKGEISEEEYNEAIAESKKKAAKEQYKIQMWQWSASILQATANIAQGVAASLAQGMPMGAISAALVAAAGAVQIASIVASKPTPPSFASGGIVPGNSYSGDRVQANVNSGEMILNAAQQRSLWEAANGRGAGGGTNIVINNSASNIVSAKPEITEDKIKILIDARVNEGLQKGKYDQSLAMANDGMGGDMWGI